MIPNAPSAHTTRTFSLLPSVSKHTSTSSSERSIRTLLNKSKQRTTSCPSLKRLKHNVVWWPHNLDPSMTYLTIHRAWMMALVFLDPQKLEARFASHKLLALSAKLREPLLNLLTRRSTQTTSRRWSIQRKISSKAAHPTFRTTRQMNSTNRNSSRYGSCTKTKF